MDLVSWFLTQSPDYLYIALFIILLVEGTGLPGVPFEPLFFATGYLIGRGEMDFWLAVFAGGTGNLAGNVLGYWIGAAPAHRLLQRFGKKMMQQAIDNPKWRFLIEKYGPAVLILARWFGPIRTFTILAAGATRMNLRSYTFYSAIGAFTWTAAWQWGSWKFAGLISTWWHRYNNQFTYKVILVLILLTLAAGGIYFWRKKGDKN